MTKKDFKAMIEELKKNLKMEVREGSRTPEYFEAVVERVSLEALNSVLKSHLGPAAKEAGKKATYPKDVQGVVDSFGGLRGDQSFFYKKEGDKIHYAALWPWQSDPDKITLKTGIFQGVPAKKTGWWQNLKGPKK